jgi:hypothetical protein
VDVQRDVVVVDSISVFGSGLADLGQQMGLHRIDLAFHGREIGVDVLHIGGYAGFIY